MKKIFSTILLLATAAMVLTGCKSEEDDLFSSSAAERLTESQNTYTQRLGGTTWLMEYYPLGTTDLDPDTRDPYPAGLGYLILNRFKTDGSVEQAMNNSATDYKYVNDVSLWEVIADQGPVLSFNTFNKCIHTFADPGIEDSSLDLYQGRGYEGDYEFGIISLEEGTQYALLKGKKRETYVRMVRLADDTDFESYLKDVNDFKSKVFDNTPNNCTMSLGDTTFVFTKGDKYIAEIYPVGGDPITENSYHAYTLAKRDGQYYIRFRDKIGRGNSDAQEFVYNAEQDVFYEASNGSYIIQGYPVGQFYNEYLATNGKKWTTKTDASMSDSFKSLIDDISTELKAVNKNFALSNVNFSYDSKNDKYVWTLSYLSSGKAANQTYYFTYQSDADSDACSFNFTEASSTAAQNVMTRCPSVQTLWDTLSQEWTLTAADTKFNLTRIKLTSKTNPDIWFVMNI